MKEYILTKFGSLIGPQVDVVSKTQQPCSTVLTYFFNLHSVNAPLVKAHNLPQVARDSASYRGGVVDFDAGLG